MYESWKSWNRGGKRRGGPSSRDGKRPRRGEDTGMNIRSVELRATELTPAQFAEYCDMNGLSTGIEDSKAAFGQKLVADMAAREAAADTQQME